MENEILLIPDKADEERDKLAEAWERRGGTVKRVGKFWVKSEVGDKRVTLYGYDSFCLVLAQILGIELLMVRDEMISELGKDYLKRDIKHQTVETLSSTDFPQFIKSVTPKLFKAAVFKSLEDFLSESGHLEKEEQLLCAEIIEIDQEVRAFILDRKICDLAFYEGTGAFDGARAFIEVFLKACKLDLPETFVLDIGYNKSDQWFVIEFNSSWGAGLNFCAPGKVLDCIRAASVNGINNIE